MPSWHRRNLMVYFPHHKPDHIFPVVHTLARLRSNLRSAVIIRSWTVRARTFRIAGTAAWNIFVIKKGVMYRGRRKSRRFFYGVFLPFIVTDILRAELILIGLSRPLPSICPIAR
jgi:hypothetical protein